MHEYSKLYLTICATARTIMTVDLSSQAVPRPANRQCLRCHRRCAMRRAALAVLLTFFVPILLLAQHHAAEGGSGSSGNSGGNRGSDSSSGVNRGASHTSGAGASSSPSTHSGSSASGSGNANAVHTRVWQVDPLGRTCARQVPIRERRVARTHLYCSGQVPS